MNLPQLPAPGQAIGNSLVLQVFPDKYEAAQGELTQVLQALNVVLAEYKDLDTDQLEATELKNIIALSGENAVRKYIADKQVKKAGTVMLGGLKLSPEALAGMLAEGEVRQLAKAIEHARERVLYIARENWNIGDFIAIEGVATPTEAAINRVYNSCIVTGTKESTKELFALVIQLADIQNEISKRFKHPYLFNTEELLTGDGKGNVVPFGGKILQRSGELNLTWTADI